MLTQLPNRKNNAYRLDLRVEDRADFQGPGLCTWDPLNDRLLYTREVHRYRVLAGTDIPYDPGTYDTELAALPAHRFPFDNVEQGDLLARIDRIPAADHLDEHHPQGTQRTVDAMATDIRTGNTLLYTHRFTPHPPYTTDLATYDFAGHLLSATTIPQPDDGTPPWFVPHAATDQGWVYGLETNPIPQLTPGSPARGRLVRRQIANLSHIAATWTPDEPYLYPHSVSLGADSIWVAATRLFQPGTDTAYQQSAIFQLDPETLAVQAEIPITFNFHDPPTPYYLGPWQPAGSPGGGLCLFESQPPAGPIFLASALSPQDYDEDWSEHPPTIALFRFQALAPGHLIGDLGDPLPTPMSYTPTGLIGNNPGELPQTRTL